MELHLDPIIPMHRKCPDGRKRFNKGYHSPMKGKTFAEIYGEERARELLNARSKRMKGHPNYSSTLANSKPIVAIYGGKIVARFPSLKHASLAVGVCYTQISKYLHRVNKPKNGWQWFFENESWKWCDLIRQ